MAVFLSITILISINTVIKLQPVTALDVDVLYALMKEIYPVAYRHFWEDDGAWYVNSQYAAANILKELAQENTDYYFILLNDEIVGNLRIIWDEKLANLPDEKQVKLHRLYLHPKTQGKGIGKMILAWLAQKAVQKEYKIIWLDAMDEQAQASQFYKKLGYKYHSHRFLDFEFMYDSFRKMSQIYKEL